VAHWVRVLPAPTGPTTILSSDPPNSNPWPTQAQRYRDVLQDQNSAGTRQGIGGTVTPIEQSITYAPIAVTFSARVNLSVNDVSVSCSYTGGQPCPTVTSVENGTMPNLVHLSGPIPPGGCTTISFTMTSDVIRYEFLPGDVNQDGTCNTADLSALQNAINNQTANLAANIPRYDIDRTAPSGGVGSSDLLRVVQLLNGENTTRVWNGVSLVPCGGGFAPGGGGGAGGSSGGGVTETLPPEDIPGVIAAIQAACASEGVDAVTCQQMIDNLFGAQP
ncbi:MAG TPA: dockerin type I domain-containing protein, partial [Roseiflexaceae bacterium]